MIPIIEKLKSRISTLEEKSAITGALITNYTITTGISATTFETIPVKNLITSKGKAFSITEEGEILCNKNMQVICFANLVLHSLKATGGKQLQIRIGQSICSYTENDISNGYRNMQTTSRIINVNKGDKIRIAYSGTAEDVVLGGFSYTTYLNVVEL